MRRISVAAKFNNIVWSDLQYLFEILADFHEGILAGTLSRSTCPNTNAVETFPDIDNYPHDLVTLVFECLADGSQLGM